MVAGSMIPALINWRASSDLAKSTALGTSWSSGCFLGTACITTFTSPNSIPLRHVTLIVSKPQQPPSTSPESAAKRMSAVPLYPPTTWIGRFRAAFRTSGKSDNVEPGVWPPILTGCLAANHLSTLVIPLALVRTQDELSPRGEPDPFKLARIELNALLPSHYLLQDQ